MRFQSTDFVLVLVLHPLRNSDFEHEDEDEDEKNQIKSHAYALNPIPCRSYETSVSFSIRPAVFLAGGWAEQ